MSDYPGPTVTPFKAGCLKPILLDAALARDLYERNVLATGRYQSQPSIVRNVVAYWFVANISV